MVRKLPQGVDDMISLNDYLYTGDTVLKILRRYAADLGADAHSRAGHGGTVVIRDVERIRRDAEG